MGTPALTTLGLSTGEMDEVADIITTVLRATAPQTATAKAKYVLDESVAATSRQRCADLLAKHPLYPGIEL
jgi:glycine hydroxymethyltransferase